MQYLDVLLALAALCGLCWFFHKVCGMAAALTPLAAVSATMLWFSFAGVCGVLYPAGWVYYLAAFGLGLYACLRKPLKTDLLAEKATLLAPGFLFFLLAAMICFVYFAIRQPIFSEWDEMSFWGTAAKLMKLNNELYTTAEIAWDWIPSQMPGLVSFSYFLQFFGGAFAPWKVLLAYNIVFFSMYAAAMSCFSFKKYSIAVPVGIIGLLTPYFLTEYTRIIQVSHVYLSSYGDIPAGMMFGAVLCWYYSWRNQPLRAGRAMPSGFFGVLLVLAAASLFKDNTFIVELVGAGIIAADLIFFGPGREGLARLKKWALRVGLAVGCFAAVAAPYMLWSKYIAALAAQREAAGQMGSTSLPLSEVVLRGFMMLFSPEKRSERFNQVSGDMLDAFLHVKIFGLGSGVLLVGIILAIFLITGLCAKEKLHRRRTWLAMGLSAAGFIGYYWVLILSYAFIFREGEARALASYNRYVQSYYLGWFLLAVMLLALGARKSRPYGFLKGTLLALCCGVTVCTAYLVQPQMSVLGYSESHFYNWRQVQASAEEIRATIPNDGKIFYVCQSDNGLGFFTYCYELLPYQMDLSFGGGEIGLPEYDDGDNIYYHSEYLPIGAEEGEEKPLDLAGLREYLTERGCKYILTQEVDDLFCATYGELFTDGLAGARDSSVLIYRRTGGEPLRYEPVPRPAGEVTA